MKRWLPVLVGLVTFAAMSAYTALRLQVSTELTDFLPVSEDDGRLAQLSHDLADSTLTRTMILSIGAPTSERAIAGARALAETLKADPEVDWLRSGVDDGSAEAYYALFFPHRYQLMSDAPEKELPARLSEEGVAKAAADLRQQLASPMGPLVKRLAPADPLLAFSTQLRRVEAMRSGSLAVRDGQFVTADGHAIIFLGTKHSAFDGTHQAPFLASVRGFFDEVNRADGGALTMAQSGVNRFAVDSERVIKSDLSRISTLSTIAIVLLFLLLFRSLRVLALSFVPLIYGVATATTAGMLVFGKLHGLTLAFGATLIGVCVDYPIHFLNHHALEPAPDGPAGSMKRILGALVLGAATTVAGFAGLAWTAFPGIRELAVFSSFGILGALAATVWFLPPLAPPNAPPVPLHRRVSDLMGRALAVITRRRAPLVVAAMVTIAVCAVGLPMTKWDDNLSALNGPNPTLLAEDEAVRAEVSQVDAGRLVVVLADDEEQALQLNDEVAARLEAAQAAGELETFRSVHGLVFSEKLQARNLAQFKAADDLRGRTLAALANQGFRPEAFSGFADSLEHLPTAPLKLSDVLASPVGDLIRPLRVDIGGRVALLTALRDVRNPKALEARLAGLPGVHYFDQEEFLAKLYGLFRVRTLQLIFFGLLLVLGILFAKYRRVDLTLAAILPAVLASAAALAILSIFGVRTNLLHVVSMLLVLSTGEDYAVFLVASAGDPKALGPTALSLVLCCLSTVLGFGLLGMSKIPALQAMGLTTGIGILLSLLLAPIALLIVRKAEP